MRYLYHDLESRSDGSASMFPAVRHIDNGKEGDNSIMSYLLHGKAFEPSSMQTEFDTKSRTITVWVSHKAESEVDICAIARMMQDKVNDKVCGAHEVLPCNVSFYNTKVRDGKTYFGYRGKWTAQGYRPEGPEIISVAGPHEAVCTTEGLPEVVLVGIERDAHQINISVCGHVSGLKQQSLLADVMTRMVRDEIGEGCYGQRPRVSTFNVFKFPKGTDMAKYGTHYGIWTDDGKDD